MQSTPTATLLGKLRSWKDDNPLRSYRTKNAITANEAATLLGVSIGTLQQWEQGARQPSTDQLSRISKVTKSNAAASWASWISRKPTA